MYRECTDHEGRTYPTIKDMCAAWGINPATYQGRIKQGWTLEKVLTTKVNYNYKHLNPNTITTDHAGNQYDSRAKMLMHYGLDATTFEYRMNHMGMSLEEALTTPATSNTGGDHTVVDHLGQEFPSKESMCTHYGIPRATFFRRLRQGMSLEEALTTPLKKTGHAKRCLKDPNGNEFSSIEEMCSYWQIPKKDYVTNIKMGMSLKEALTHKPDKNWHQGATPCKDHLGNEFPSFNAMFKHYGIAKDNVRGRIDLGWTLKEILESPKKKPPQMKCKDHLGKEFVSQKEMLAAYGVNPNQYRWRKIHGWTLEECLLGQGPHRNQVTDHEGNIYPSERILCIFYNMTPSTYYTRRNDKWPKEKMLYAFTKESFGTFGENITLVKRLKNYYYEVIIDDQRYVMHAQQIIEYYREHKLWPSLGYRIIKFKEDGSANIVVDGKYKTISYEDVSADVFEVLKKFKKYSETKGSPLN